jgi:hypothetical protein
MPAHATGVTESNPRRKRAPAEPCKVTNKCSPQESGCQRPTHRPPGCGQPVALSSVSRHPPVGLFQVRRNHPAPARPATAPSPHGHKTDTHARLDLGYRRLRHLAAVTSSPNGDAAGVGFPNAHEAGHSLSFALSTADTRQSGCSKQHEARRGSSRSTAPDPRGHRLRAQSPAAGADLAPVLAGLRGPGENAVGAAGIEPATSRV